jgi:hypothetical protein
MHGASAGAKTQIDTMTPQEALDELKIHFPSPLVGEGQGEGDNTRERSEHSHSKLITKNSKLLKR